MATASILINIICLVLILIFVIIHFALSISVLVKFAPYGNLFQNERGLAGYNIFISFIGLLVVIFGLLAVTTDRRVLARIVAYVSIALGILALVSLIVALVYNSRALNNVSSRFGNYVNQYSTGSSSKNIVDKVQTTYSCCGEKTWLDWSHLNLGSTTTTPAATLPAGNMTAITTAVVVPETTTGVVVAPATTTGAILVPETTTGVVVVPATTTGAVVVPATTTGAILVPETTTGVVVVPATTTGAILVPATTTGVVVVPATTTGVVVVPETTKGVVVVPGTTEGVVVVPETTKGVVVVPETTKGVVVPPATTAAPVVVVEMTTPKIEPQKAVSKDVSSSPKDALISRLMQVLRWNTQSERQASSNYGGVNGLPLTFGVTLPRSCCTDSQASNGVVGNSYCVSNLNNASATFHIDGCGTKLGKTASGQTLGFAVINSFLMVLALAAAPLLISTNRVDSYAQPQYFSNPGEYNQMSYQPGVAYTNYNTVQM